MVADVAEDIDELEGIFKVVLLFEVEARDLPYTDLSMGLQLPEGFKIRPATHTSTMIPKP